MGRVLRYEVLPIPGRANTLMLLAELSGEVFLVQPVYRVHETLRSDSDIVDGWRGVAPGVELCAAHAREFVRFVGDV